MKAYGTFHVRLVCDDYEGTNPRARRIDNNGGGRLIVGDEMWITAASAEAFEQLAAAALEAAKYQRQADEAKKGAA